MSGKAYHLSPLCTLLDVHDELLLALLEFCALAVEFALRLCQRALMLAQTLRWRYSATEERFLRLKEKSDVSVQRRLWEIAVRHDDFGRETYYNVHDKIRWKRLQQRAASAVLYLGFGRTEKWVVTRVV